MLKSRNRCRQTAQFNMTPIIDIVFLLIIFFMLVCQFIVAENFEVTVPDDIDLARAHDSSEEQTATVTVMFDQSGEIAYAVGSEIIPFTSGEEIAIAIANAINRQLYNLPINHRVVSLRIDKNIPYCAGQYALAGSSQSSATHIKLAAVKQKQW